MARKTLAEGGVPAAARRFQIDRMTFEHAVEAVPMHLHWYLLGACYMADRQPIPGTLPANDRALCALLRVGARQWAEVRAALRQMFTLTLEDRIGCPWLMTAADRAHAVSAVRQASGKLGGATQGSTEGTKRGKRREANGTPNAAPVAAPFAASMLPTPSPQLSARTRKSAGQGERGDTPPLKGGVPPSPRRPDAVVHWPDEELLNPSTNGTLQSSGRLFDTVPLVSRRVPRS